MTEHDQEEGVSPVEEAGLDETDTGYGFRPKPSPQNYQYATERDRIQNFSDDKM
jgi:hypothetical protein